MNDCRSDTWVLSILAYALLLQFVRLNSPPLPKCESYTIAAAAHQNLSLPWLINFRPREFLSCFFPAQVRVLLLPVWSRHLHSLFYITSSSFKPHAFLIPFPSKHDPIYLFVVLLPSPWFSRGRRSRCLDFGEFPWVGEPLSGVFLTQTFFLPNSSALS